MPLHARFSRCAAAPRVYGTTKVERTEGIEEKKLREYVDTPRGGKERGQEPATRIPSACELVSKT